MAPYAEEDAMTVFCTCCGSVTILTRDTGAVGQRIYLGSCRNGTRWRIQDCTEDDGEYGEDVSNITSRATVAAEG